MIFARYNKFFRGWLLYPNYNYVSWSYAFAVFAMVSGRKFSIDIFLHRQKPPSVEIEIRYFFIHISASVVEKKCARFLEDKVHRSLCTNLASNNLFNLLDWTRYCCLLHVH
jgi:hypothetical protein